MSSTSNLFWGALTGVLLVAIIVGIVFLVVGQQTPLASAQDATQGATRNITVVGNGSVAGTPDTASVDIGVETRGDTAADALTENTTQVNEMLERMQDLGIDEKDIQTSNFSIYAEYNRDGDQIVGYNVNNTVSVKIRDLTSAGELLDQVVQVGANRIYGISFYVDEPAELQAQARDAAIADARAKAERMAQQSGATLGEVLTITENVGSPIEPVLYAETAQAAVGGAVPIQAGEQAFNVNIQVTFALR